MRLDRERVIGALLAHPTRRAAAEDLGVSTRTLERAIAEDPEIGEAYRVAQRELLSRIIGQLSDSCLLAIDSLERCMDEASPPAVQVRAAGIVLSTSLRYLEAYELEERIGRLEAAMREKR